LKTEDGSVNIRFSGEHARVVNQISRREVIGAVRNDVEVAEHFERIRAAQLRIERPQIEVRINRLQLVGRGIQLLAPYVGGEVNNLPLQIGVIHHIEIDQPQRS